MSAPILFVGGTGVVGRQAATLFRERNPHAPILIGGRDAKKAAALADEIGGADAVRVDINQPHLGLNPDTRIGAVAMMIPDEGLHGISHAQDLQVPYLSIGNWLVEIGAEVAHFNRRPHASSIVLASHWHGGSAVFLTQLAMRGMSRIDSVHISAIIDDEDPTGPAAISDMKRGAVGGSDIWAFTGGRRAWLTDEEATRPIETLDGRVVDGQAITPYDIVSLHALSGARDIRFDLATIESSSRRRGGNIATELIVEIRGECRGQAASRRHTLEFDRGQAVLTGLGAALALSAVLGLDGGRQFPPGLYFPEQVMNVEQYLCELKKSGAFIDVEDM